MQTNQEKWKRLFPDGITVFSAFDGISGTQVALERLEIPIRKYISSEIDKPAITVTQSNYPNTIQLGDITKIKPEDVGEVDLMVFGSPCQGFSNSGKHGGIKDERSGLLLPALKLMRAIKPKYFLIENVRMKNEWLRLLDELIGVPHIQIDSALLTAQSRKRCYWTNIPNVDQPEDLGLVLADIVEPDVTSEILYQEPYYKKNNKKSGVLGYVGNKPAQATRVYSIDQKSKCLSALGGGQGGKTGLYEIGAWRGRKINPETGEREDDNPNLSYTQKLEMRNDSKSNTLTSVDKDNVVVKSFVDRDKSYCIDANYFKGGNLKSYFEKGRRQLVFLDEEKTTCRKLIPIECERLQSFPDGYTKVVSNTQRYKCLGNSFTVDVIAHILSNMDGTIAEQQEQLEFNI